MELVHKPVVEGGKVFEAFGARFFQSFEEEDLSPWVELLKKLAELGHCIAARLDTQNIVNKAFDELLGHIFGGQVPNRKLS